MAGANVGFGWANRGGKTTIAILFDREIFLIAVKDQNLRAVGVSLQDPFLFRDDFGKYSLTAGEKSRKVIAAAVPALINLMKRLPQDMDKTFLGRNGLSQGQRQLLTMPGQFWLIR